MKVLYVGLYGAGQTSRMRGELLKQLLQPDLFHVVNTEVPASHMHRAWRSLAFRYKMGPLIRRVNDYVVQHAGSEKYDLVWVDKAIYLTKATTQILRRQAERMLHFTPDPAFQYHKSFFFRDSLPLYDMAVTTKSYEVGNYKALIGEEKLMLITQGFDSSLHRSSHDFSEKKGVVFVGHATDERKRIIRDLINNQVEVKLAGIYWEKFARENRHNSFLHYIGKGIFSEAYAQLVSSSLFGLGLVSRVVPELHTTRTFEIPACGTALVTERNAETAAFFEEGEVIFFDRLQEITGLIRQYMEQPHQLKSIIERGHAKVVSGGYDYASILMKILDKLGIKEQTAV